jgi:hypothetical protein
MGKETIITKGCKLLLDAFQFVSIIIIMIIINNTRKAFIRFSTKNSCTRNTKHFKESATIRNLKPEW